MSEFPPVIIDSTNLCDDSFYNRPDVETLFVHVAGFGTGSAETASVRASITSLYLIKDNKVIYKGDFGPDEIEIVYSSASLRAATAGSGDLIPGSEAGLDAGAATVASEVPQRRVASIRTGKQELHEGRDFHNFLLVLRRTVED